jgi:hypothetical protein
MLVWKGRGIYLVIVFGIILYLYYLIFIDDKNSKIFDSYGPAIAFLLSGLLFLSFSNDWKKEGKVYFDPKKNKEVTKRPDDSLFFINVYYWSYLFIILGILCFYSLWK